MGRVAADASWVVDDNGIVIGQRLADGSVVAPNVIRSYTAAQLSALAAAGGLTQWATYVASDTSVVYRAVSASSLAAVSDGASTKFTQLERAQPPTLNVSGGSALTGTYYYRVSFYTALGETEAGPYVSTGAITAKDVVMTNIPIGADPATIGRRIYRSLAAGNQYAVYLVVDIADNTTTQYTDTKADGALGALAPHANSTGGRILMTTTGTNGASFPLLQADETTTTLGYRCNPLQQGYNLTAMGVVALEANTTGYNNCAFGNGSLTDNTTGKGNSAYGYASLQLLTTGVDNCAFGVSAANKLTASNYNVAFGAGAMANIGTGTADGNVAIGREAMATGTAVVSYNTAIGYRAGNVALTSHYNVFIGYLAGGNASQATNVSNSIAIGKDTFTKRSNAITIGSDAIVETQMRAGVKITLNDTTLTAPNAAAGLDMSALTTQGLYLPVMTTTQKNAVSSPPEGLLVYDITLHKLCIRTASAWETVTSV